MIRSEAYAVMDGMLVVIVATCTGARHAGDKCEPIRVVQLVTTGRIEHFGVGAAVVDAVEQALHEHPEMAHRILC